MMRAVPVGSEPTTEQQIDRLIDGYIEPYPGRPDPAEVRLKVDEGGVPIWALIGALSEDGENADAVARDYRVRREAIDAAWAYYQRHRAAIDAKLASALVP
jgi:uncharacterized protein (DUF433 family)